MNDINLPAYIEFDYIGPPITVIKNGALSYISSLYWPNNISDYAWIFPHRVYAEYLKYLDELVIKDMPNTSRILEYPFKKLKCNCAEPYCCARALSNRVKKLKEEPKKRIQFWPNSELEIKYLNVIQEQDILSKDFTTPNIQDYKANIDEKDIKKNQKNYYRYGILLKVFLSSPENDLSKTVIKYSGLNTFEAANYLYTWILYKISVSRSDIPLDSLLSDIWKYKQNTNPDIFLSSDKFQDYDKIKLIVFSIHALILILQEEYNTIMKIK